MNIFLINFQQNKQAFLDQEEARHCIKALRKKVGDQIHGIDGKGNKHLAQISEIGRNEVLLDILDTETEWGEKLPYVRMALSPLRTKDRLEWAIEKAVELGVNEICPVICHRTVKTGFKVSRMQSIILSALKQSKRSRLPLLREVQSLEKYLASSGKGLKLFPWCETDKMMRDFTEEIRNAQDISICIGPEGDFSETEVELAKSYAYHPVSLGENRLRTETAAIYTLGALKWTAGW